MARCLAWVQGSQIWLTINSVLLLSINIKTLVGFTITKKIGGAVIRNKIKRRFRTIIREIFTKYLKKNYDYVIIANKKSLIMDYKELKSDVIKTVK